MSRFFFACQHFIGGWLAAHGIGNGHLGGFVVVVVDFFVVIGLWVDEHTTNNHEVLALILGDHAITDAVDAEAYKLYDADLDDILGSDARQNPTALTAVDAESLQRTFEFKGFHLLKAIPNNPRQTLINRVEAMRQIRKQFDNLVLPRITAGGSGLDAALPPKTLVAYRLFQRVESGDITPAQAEVGLGAIGLTLEQSFVLMADGINQVVRASQ